MNCLSEFDLANTIQFLGQSLRAILENNEDFINNHESLAYYVNNGPDVKFLYRYYRFARNRWLSLGGEKIDWLSAEERECICQHHGGEVSWTPEMANVHKFALLERDHFWYQRFFVEEPFAWRYRRLRDTRLFINGNPTTLSTEELEEKTYEISRSDIETYTKRLKAEEKQRKKKED